MNDDVVIMSLHSSPSIWSGHVADKRY